MASVPGVVPRAVPWAVPWALPVDRTVPTTVVLRRDFRSIKLLPPYCLHDRARTVYNQYLIDYLVYTDRVPFKTISKINWLSSVR